MVQHLLSYARENAAFVEGELAPALEQRGEEVWIDVEDIRGGAADWRASVWAAIEAAKAVVFVLSPVSMALTVCAEELEHAEALNKRIVPALLESVDGAALPAALERPNWVPARDFDALGAALELDEAWLNAHARLTQRTTSGCATTATGATCCGAATCAPPNAGSTSRPGTASRRPPTRSCMSPRAGARRRGACGRCSRGSCWRSR